MLKKIALTKTLIDDRDILLEVDGGISPLNSKDVINAGANVLVAGSSIFSSNRNANYSKNIAALRN
jgi:ribulose-phosphate 3-epimerase